MSMSLMARAMNIKVGNPIRKLVLLKLADNANDKGECWPIIVNAVKALFEITLMHWKRRVYW